MAKYATLKSLQRFWDGLKDKFVAQVEGKGLSTNDLTDELKSHYDAAEANVIETIKVNGTAVDVSIDDKSVNVTVPTKTSELDNDSGFATTESTYDKETIDGKITTLNEAIAAAAAGNVSITIVESVPEVADAVEKTIYFVAKTDTDDNDVFDEYMLINGSIELLGSTKVDLTDYVKTTDLEEISDDEVDSIFTEG